MNRALGRSGFAAGTYPTPRGGGGPSSTLLWASVANFAALTALPLPTTGAQGLIAYVESVKDYFHLDTNSAVALTSATVLATSLGGNTRWIRMEVPHPFWAQQASWGINATTGNDENAGSPAAPLQTWAEFMRRVGQGTVIRQTTTVQLLSDLPATDPLAGHLTIATNIFFQIIGGVASILQAGTLTAVTNLDRPTNTAWTITDAGEDFTAEVGHRLRNTTAGARLNAISWVGRVDPGGGGNIDTARTSLPVLMPGVSSGAIKGTDSSWVNGDTYNVETLITARMGDLWIEEDRSNLTARFPTVVFSEINFVGTAQTIPNTNNTLTLYYGCRFATQVQQFGLNQNVFFANCCFAGGFFVTDGRFECYAGLAVGTNVAERTMIVLDQDFLIQGSVALWAGAHATLGTVGIFNAAVSALINPLGAGIVAGASSTGVARNTGGSTIQSKTYNSGAVALYGASNLVGVHIGAGCQMRYQTLANVTIAGAAADAAFRLGVNAAAVDVINPAAAAFPIFANIATTWAALAGHDAGNVINIHNLASIVAGA